jgi:hypothetical protein
MPDPPATAAAPAPSGGETAPPRRGVLLPLVLLPGTLVAVIVLVWLTLSWLMHQRTDPRRLVRDLLPPRTPSWQKALALAELLHNPAYRDLKRDPAAARDLAALLDAHLTGAAPGPESVKLCVFLCRTLGEFESDEVLPVLVRAARAERRAADSDVRRAALEAIAVLAGHLGADQLSGDAALREAVTAAAAERSPDGVTSDDRAALRAGAAFLLGTLPGDWARRQLEQLLSDAAPNVRFNAATGLAYRGEPAAIAVLTEMLDTGSVAAVDGETTAAGQQWKQALVITGALRAVRMLEAKNPAADTEPLRAALARLATADVSRGIRTAARETLQALKPMPAK